MAPTWNAQMQERFESLETRFDDLGERIDKQFAAVGERFDALDQKFDAIDQKFEAVDERFDDMEGRLSRKIDVQMDDVRDLLRKSAEAYGASLEAIDRRLMSLQGDLRTLHTKYQDTFPVLANHEERIAALEKPRRGRSR